MKTFITSWWDFSKRNTSKDAPWAGLHHIKNSAWDRLLWYCVSPVLLRNDGCKFRVIFSKFIILLYQIVYKKNTNKPFCRGKKFLSFETFRASKAQTIAEIFAKYEEDRKTESFQGWYETWKMSSIPFSYRWVRMSSNFDFHGNFSWAFEWDSQIQNQKIFGRLLPF